MKKKLIIATLLAVAAAYWAFGLPGLIVVAVAVVVLATLDALGVERSPATGETGGHSEDNRFTSLKAKYTNTPANVHYED